MRLLENLGIQHPVYAAGVTLHAYLSERSVALLLTPQPSHLEIGSGTCVRIGDRVLVATAAHNLQGLEHQDQIQIIPKGGSLEAPLRWTRKGIQFSKDGKKTDVAWIELAPQASSSPQLKCFGVDDLAHRMAPDDQVGCHVQGYPSATVEVTQAPRQHISVESDGLLTLSIPKENWTDQSQTEIDFVVEYPPHDGSLDHLDLPPPPGLSGGGIWLAPRFEDERLWSPEQASLLAITRSWRKQQRELYGTRIRVWLQLVRDDFEDLRDLLEKELGHA